MGKTTESKLTLRQAVSGKWQIPLFLLSLVAFAGVLWQLVPKKERPSFEQSYQFLQELARENRYQEFYGSAEQLRKFSETEAQLGRVHALVAQTRVRELKQRRELGIDLYQRRSARVNYENIIKDYHEALHRNWIDPNTPAGVPVFHDFSLTYWALNDTEKAILSLQRAINVADRFDPTLHRSLVRMMKIARPKGYLEKSLVHLEQLLTDAASTPDDKAWAFVKKAEVLIARGQEDLALAMLNAADESQRNSAYRDELVLLRGRALRHAGHADEADRILRNLIGEMTDRGDTYAQVALELGKINYEQFRDYDARQFYDRVVSTQSGRDWYAAGLLGLAECAALQQRYDETIGLYRSVVDILDRPIPNRAVEPADVQQSLVLLADQLALLKRYDLALPFLEIEQRIASQNDLSSADRFARIHYALAMQLLDDFNKSQPSDPQAPTSPMENSWAQQQQTLITTHFEQAGEQFLRVASLAVENDGLYGKSLWYAATCYDKAGNFPHAIEVWKRFVDQRQGKSRWPEALFNLAQAHQAMGHFDAAITYYQELRTNHPRTPAALQCIVPLAHCYLVKDKPENEKAEQLLISVLEDRTLRPPANVFRRALFELGELHYKNQNYPQAITLLIEGIDRYPDEKGLGKYMFLVGDSYRKSGLKLDDTLAKLEKDPTATVSREKTTNLRRKYLKQAQHYYTQAIAYYEKIPEVQRTPLNQLYLRHSWMYSADCLFDLGMYPQAALLYEEVALRYQLTPTALIAFTQIVNCHLKVGNPLEAASANRRAIWQLTKMSDEALAGSTVSLNRQQWQDWFNWSESAGLW